MAAQEHQQERVVGLLRRPGLGLLGDHLLAPSPSGLGPLEVDELALRDGDQPAARLVGELLGPRPVGLDQCLLDGVLGRCEVGAAPDQDTEHLRAELPQQRLGHSLAGASSITGRTSSHS